MDEGPLYAFLLDFFPLVDEIARENAAIGAALQAIALECLLADDAQELAQARTLLRLAGDLGYTSPEVVRFLTRELEKTLRAAGAGP